MNYSNSYDEKCEKYNVAEVLSIVPKNEYSNELYEKIESLDDVELVEKRECINMTTSIDFADSKFSLPHVFFNMDEIGKVDRIGIIEETYEDVDNPIYISYWLKMAGGYRIGDPYVIESKDNKYTFNVAGFVEDMNYGRGICGCVGAYLPEDEFKSFEEKVNENYKFINLQCKVKDIINSIVLTYISISVGASILGICSSYALLPYVEMALNSQNGLLWNQSFDFKSMLVTIAIILILTAVISYLSARKIKRLSPILALRGGIETHNFKKNHFEIEKTFGNVNFIISLKNLVTNVKQNTLLFLVIIAVNLAAAFASVMFYNINVDSKAFVNCITEESPSVRFTVSEKENLDSTMDDIKNLDNVKLL